MKPNVIIIFIVLILFLSCSTVSASINIYRCPDKVTAIIIGVQCSPAAKTGAEELKYYLEKITGEKLPIFVDTGPIPPTAIFVGESKVTQKAGINKSSFKTEGFIIRTIEQGLVLMGDDGPGNPFSLKVRTGTLFAVYDFLERFGKVRWLWPGEDGEVITRQPSITIPSLDIREEPAFIIRSVKLGFMRSEKKPALIEAEWNKWAKRQKMGWVPQMWFGHSVKIHFPSDRYFAVHPEYFALVQGVRRPHQLCTSNQSMQKELVRKILQAKEDVVSISPADGKGFCECDNCRALDIPGLFYKGRPTEPDLSQRIFTFVDQVAKAVHKENPQKGVGIFAYNYYRQPPSQLDHLPNNIYLSLTFSNVFFRDLAYKKDFFTLIDGWTRKGVELVARESWGAHYWLDLPIVQLKGIAEILPRLKDNRFLGIYGEGGKNFATQGVNYYLLAKLMWNPNQPAQAVMDDYYRHAYGPAAPAMQQYWEFLEGLLTKNWSVLKLKGHKPEYGEMAMNWPQLLPLPELKKAEGYLTEALNLARSNPEFRRRVEYTAYGLRYAQNMVQLLAAYGKLQAGGVKIGFAHDPQRIIGLDQGQKTQWLQEAQRLGNIREKLLFAPENTNSFRLDEGLYNFAAERKLRLWHQRVSDALEATPDPDQ